MKTNTKPTPQPEVLLKSLLEKSSVAITAEIAKQMAEKKAARVKPTEPVYVDRFGIPLPPNKPMLLEYDHL